MAGRIETTPSLHCRPRSAANSARGAQGASSPPRPVAPPPPPPPPSGGATRAASLGDAGGRGRGWGDAAQRTACRQYENKQPQAPANAPSITRPAPARPPRRRPGYLRFNIIGTAASDLPGRRGGGGPFYAKRGRKERDCWKKDFIRRRLLGSACNKVPAPLRPGAASGYIERRWDFAARGHRAGYRMAPGPNPRPQRRQAARQPPGQ